MTSLEAALRRIHSDLTTDELVRAREALLLITSRGYHRSRDLLAEFQALFDTAR